MLSHGAGHGWVFKSTMVIHTKSRGCLMPFSLMRKLLDKFWPNILGGFGKICLTKKIAAFCDRWYFDSQSQCNENLRTQSNRLKSKASLAILYHIRCDAQTLFQTACRYPALEWRCILFCLLIPEVGTGALTQVGGGVDREEFPSESTVNEGSAPQASRDFQWITFSGSVMKNLWEFNYNFLKNLNF